MHQDPVLTLFGLDQKLVRFYKGVPLPRSGLVGDVYILYIYLHYYIIYDHIIFVISDHMFMLVPLKWFIRVGDLSIGEESVRSNSPQLVASIIH